MSSDSSQAGATPASFSSPPWNPVTIGWWGLFCGPYWTSLMAGLNISRLGQKRSTIWPSLIFIVGLMLAFADPFVWLYRTPTWLSYVYQVVLSFGAMGLLWGLILSRQKGPFVTQTREIPGARFTIPVILGILPGLQLWGYLLLTPIILLTTETPTQVCDIFCSHEDVELVRRHCTVNMYRTLDLMKKFREGHGVEASPAATTIGIGYTYELQPETVIAQKPGRRQVDIRKYYPAENGSESVLLDGYFELQYVDDVWLIDELFFTHMNHEPFPQGNIRFEELLKLAIEAQKLSFPDQQFNRNAAPGEATLAERYGKSIALSVADVSSHSVRVVPQAEISQVLPERFEDASKETSRSEVKPPRGRPHDFHRAVVHAVCLLLFVIFPAMRAFLFGASTPSGLPVASDSEGPPTS